MNTPRRVAPVFAFCVALAAAGAAAAGPVTKGLALWLDASNGLATNGSVWADQSGHAHNATALAGQAPLYKAAALNGLPVAQFSGAQAMAVSGALLPKQTFTVMAVVTDTSTYTANNDFREIMSNWTPATGGLSIFLGTLWTNVTGATLDRLRFTDAVGGAGQGQAGVGTIPHPTKAFIVTGEAQAKNAKVWLGTKLQYALGAALPARDLTQPFYIGRQGTLDGEYWQGDIAEILVYNRALTPAEFKANAAYLSAKW